LPNRRPQGISSHRLHQGGRSRSREGSRQPWRRSARRPRRCRSYLPPFSPPRRTHSCAFTHIVWFFPREGQEHLQMTDGNQTCRKTTAACGGWNGPSRRIIVLQLIRSGRTNILLLAGSPQVPWASGPVCRQPQDTAHQAGERTATPAARCGQLLTRQAHPNVSSPC